ncbi:glycoside hydrolase family 25 protein [Ruminococcus champanellensis]|uniref:glycoside hydrolase family 25 protein n=1 Tax=Ruminococcus champanellensis TaxID=1161942 RepID=UPI0023F3AF2E|nr:glycoside hydrolase family 25 protein [Ruminococcus champanellensis]
MAKTRKNFIICIQSVLILGLLCLVAFLLIRMRHQEEPAVPANAGMAQNSVQEDISVIPKGEIEVDWNYELSGKKILLSDATYGQIYLPVYDNVPAFAQNREQIVNRNGRRYYVSDGQITSDMGIDVSAHQGDIDWDKVKASGINFVFIRIGYRTYGGGDIMADSMFRQNYEGAKAAGLQVGVYFFSQAISEEEAVQEANFVVKQLQGCKLELPVTYDWELIYDDTARTDNVPVDVLTDCCLAFSGVVEHAGYEPMIYQNKRTSLLKLDLPRLQGISFWLAEYGSIPTYYYDCQYWQYSCKGKVPGIEGDVDLNIRFS